MRRAYTTGVVVFSGVVIALACVVWAFYVQP